MRADVRSDVREVQRALRGMGQGTDRVIVRAINRGIRTANTASVRGVSKELGVRQKRVRDMMAQRFARSGSYRAFIEPQDGRRLPLSELAARQTQRGVSFRGRPGQGRQTVPGAFLATMKSGYHGVFKRTGKRRLPIAELFGPSVPFVFLRDHVIAATDKAAREDVVREAYRQLDLLRTQQGL